MKNKQPPDLDSAWTPQDDNHTDYASMRVWQSLCRNVVNPLPHRDLAAEILRKRQEKESRQRRLYFRYAAVIAFLIPAISLVFTSQLVSNHSNSSVADLQQFNSINQPQQIKFVVSAVQSHDDVNFSIQAPAQWTFYGYKGSRHLSWNGKLQAGQNLLSIPLVAHEAVAGTLVVTISHKGSIKEYRIPIDVNRQPV